MDLKPRPSGGAILHYGLRFSIEELFLDSKSGAFQLEMMPFGSVE